MKLSEARKMMLQPGNVERALSEVKSKQPRFNKTDPSQVYTSVMNFMQLPEFANAPNYSADSRERDRWLRAIWPKEPHFSGVLSSVCMIDTNRGWELIGGRNQVNRYTKIMHYNFWAAPGMQGYRPTMRSASQSFYTSDLGFIGELSRDRVISNRIAEILLDPEVSEDEKKEVMRQVSNVGPVRGLFFVDPTTCRLQSNPEYPLQYCGEKKYQDWSVYDYIRVTSMPSTDEKMLGVGLCALSRVLEVLKIMIGILVHDQEAVRARLPEALLLLQGISQRQWDDAMSARDQELDRMSYEYFGNVYTLASQMPISAQLFQFSQIPENLDRELFTFLYMALLALNFGYPAEEFWPVKYGGLGRSTEAMIQQRQSATKGSLDFCLSFQEKWQAELPDTLHFEFMERDVEGEIQEAQLQSQQIDNVVKMFQAQNQTSGEVLTNSEESRSLLVTDGIFPDEWTIAEEDTSATDEEQEARARFIHNDRVMRSAYKYPDQPIVCYQWPTGNVRLISMRGADLMSKRNYSIPRKRQVDETIVLYQGDDFEITSQDVLTAITEGARRMGDDGEEYANLLTAPIWEEQENE